MRSSHSIFKKKETNILSNQKKIDTKYIPKVKIPKDYSLGINFNTDDTELERHYRKSLSQMNIEIKEKKETLEKNLEEYRANEEKKIKKELENRRKDFKAKLATEQKKMVKDVETDIQLLKEVAKEKGYEEGFQNSYEKGYENGYQVSIDETKELRRQASTLIDKANQEVSIYQNEKKKEILDLVIQVAENIIHREIDRSDEKLYVLLDPILNRMNKMDNFITIFVGKANVEVVKKRLDILKYRYPEMKYAVLIDETLEKNGCWIETDYEVLDLQIKKQLEAIQLECLNLEEI